MRPRPRRAWLLALGATLHGCTCGYCEPEAIPVGKDDTQWDGTTPSEFMAGLDTEYAIELSWLGRDDEDGISFELPAYADTGTLRLEPDWSTAEQRDGGAEPCGHPGLSVGLSATILTDDGTLDHTFELTAVQDGEDREISRDSASADAFIGTIELPDPMPPTAQLYAWLFELDCSAEACDGTLFASVVVSEPSAAQSTSVPRVPIATWVTVP